MKKLIGSLWVKVIAVILCLAGFSGCILSIIGIVVKAELSSEEKFTERVYESIARNYSAKMLESYLQGDADAFSDMSEETNLRFTVLKSYVPYETASDWIEKGEVLHGDIKKSESIQYMFQGGPQDKGSYIYNVDSLQRAMGTYAEYNSSLEEMPREKIRNLVYAKDKGIIYIQTASGFFPVPNLIVRFNNTQVVIEFCREIGEASTYVKGTRMSLKEYPQQDWYYLEIKDAGGNYSGYVTYPTEKEYVPDPSSPDLNHLYAVNKEAELKGAKYDTYFYFAEQGWIAHPQIIDHPYYCVLSYVDSAMPAKDLFAEAQYILVLLFRFLELAPVLQVAFLAVFLVSLLFLIAAAGHRKGTNTIVIRCWDRIPYGIYLSIEGIIVCCVIGFFAEGLLEMARREILYLIFVVELVVLLEFLLLAFVLSTAVRIKAKVFWRYTLLHYVAIPFRCCFGKIRRFEGYVQETYQNRLSLLRKTIAAIMAVVFIELFLAFAAIVAAEASGGAFLLILLIGIIFKGMQIAWILLAVAQMKRLQDGGIRVARGELGEPVDTRNMFWEFKKHGETINQLGDGISLAVEKQMKSERFRTELITNVSHDIKTPLTSIINYVDLIKKEGFTEPPMAEYVEVLDRQSARLKKLVDDLMEASKASTGNLTVALERCDATVLLTQVVGEFEESLQANELQLIVHAPEEPVYITADSRHLWRVFDNLLGNIRKYAQPGTRVYINLEPGEIAATIIFRNISHYQLNMSSEELMERFVRGDASRNTEGSGLGLNITQSLMELMHGSMHLEIDGDLFKVTLQLPLHKGNQTQLPLQGGSQTQLPQQGEGQAQLPQQKENPAPL